MRIFVTGATGFVGFAVVKDLLAHGHQVLGLSRSDEGARALEAAGADVRRGDLTEPDGLAAAARECDGVAHLAFIHDFSRFMENIAIDRRAVEAMVGALEGSNKPFVLTSGLGFITPGRAATEADLQPREGAFSGRGLTEYVVLDAAKNGVRGMVIRLPQVHGPHDHGFTAQMVAAARRLGYAPYVGEGLNRWSACHRDDVARLYRLALEKGQAGAIFHAVAEEGIATRTLAEAIADGLGMSARGLTPDEAGAAFGVFAPMAAMDCPASSAITRKTLGWEPVGPDLLTDLRNEDYLADRPIKALA
jgi:nucleoside-diphosphate-sugar epimerase